jgi:hypothetical protein
MLAKRALWILLPLFILGCSDDSTTVQPPAPLTPDQQTVANVRAYRDALETYATAHNGTYGEYYVPSPKDLGLGQMLNVYTGEFEPSGIRAMCAGQIGLEGYYCDGTEYGYRVTGYGKDHTLITLEALEKVPADVRYTHDVTVANAFLLLDAAKRFAAANNGVFSLDVNGDTNQDGKTLIDMLPNGELLINPFEGQKTEPQDGNALGIAGAIGYIGYDTVGSGEVDGFNIEAYHCDLGVMLTLAPTNTAYGGTIWDGSYRLRFAVESFAKASGHYPHNLDTETTPGGKTVLDLISQKTEDHVPTSSIGTTESITFRRSASRPATSRSRISPSKRQALSQITSSPVVVRLKRLFALDRSRCPSSRLRACSRWGDRGASRGDTSRGALRPAGCCG